MTSESEAVQHVRATVSLKIPFHDVDAAGIGWHGHYLKYFEIARCELLDGVDYNYTEMRDSGFFWPVIDVRIRYAQPLKFQQNIRVEAVLKEWENRLKIDYTIRDSATNKRLTRGHTVQVAVCLESGEMQLASPPILKQKLGLS